jgi:hypothetical protein
MEAEGRATEKHKQRAKTWVGPTKRDTLCCVSERMSGTDKDKTAINSRLLVSFYCESGVVAYFYMVKSRKLGQTVSRSG